MSRRVHLLLVLVGLIMVWQGLYLYAGEEALHGPVETVRDTAKAAGTTPQISTCITGLRADKMKNVDSDALISHVFQKVVTACAGL